MKPVKKIRNKPPESKIVRTKWDGVIEYKPKK
jgi:hypothetical protein